MRETFIPKLKLALAVLIASVIVIPTAVIVPHAVAAQNDEVSGTTATETHNDKKVALMIAANKLQAENGQTLALERAKAMDNAKAETQKKIKELEALAQKEAQEKAEKEAQQKAAAEKAAAEKAAAEKAAAEKAAAEKAEREKEEAEQAQQEREQVQNDGYLLGIENPDYDYVSYSISLTDEDRDILERLVMGEAGDQGYIGCALVAQAIRDTMIADGVPTVEQVRTGYGYYGSLSRTPNSDVKRAVEFIFDQGGAAVQHKLMYFYETSLCSSAWHETQDYVVTYNTTRFFDRA